MRLRALIVGMAVAGVAQLVAAPPALADFFTVPETFTLPISPTNWGRTIPVQEFNPLMYNTGGKLAVLEGVNVRIDYEFDNTLTMQFFNKSTITVSATGTVKVENLNGGTLLTSPPFTNSQTLTLTPPAGSTQTVSFPTKVITGSVSSPSGGFTDLTTLKDFTGIGKINLPVVANASSLFSTSSGNGFGSSVTEAKATITISYRYALVPEPSSLGLAGLGCLGLLGVCRQRTRLKGLKAA